MRLFRRMKTNSKSTRQKIKYSKYANNLGYDEVIREKQEEYSVWYSGDSDKLLDYYINARPIQHRNIEEFRNRKDFFWAVVGKEDAVKCTHSGLPKAMIDATVSVIGVPEIIVSKDEVVDENGVKTIASISDVQTTERINKIIEDNEFFTILSQDQIPYTLVVGDGAFFINIDEDLSDNPIIEFIDGRNVEFERKANRIISITARKYYSHEDKGYMLTDTRSTRLIKEEKGSKKRVATVEYHLYELTNYGSDEVTKEVDLNSIPDTANLESLEFTSIDCMLAVPCIFRYDKEAERGASVFAGKLDLFDDLDQSKSQASNTTRLSTPVDYIPEGLQEYDSFGKPIPPKRYDRRYVTLPADRNAIGQNINQITTTQPDLNVGGYTMEQEQLIGDILTGFMSPATLGVNISIKDNAAAQREKEKITLVTRDNLIATETEILRKLFNLALKVDDYMQNKEIGDYDITVNYPEYANPTFENKLAYLSPAFASGAMSAKQYVNELWGDSLSEEEIKEEIEALENYRDSFNQMQDFDSSEDEYVF